VLNGRIGAERTGCNATDAGLMDQGLVQTATAVAIGFRFSGVLL
jgi:hypothetical protein